MARLGPINAGRKCPLVEVKLPCLTRLQSDVHDVEAECRSAPEIDGHFEFDWEPRGKLSRLRPLIRRQFGLSQHESAWPATGAFNVLVQLQADAAPREHMGKIGPELLGAPHAGTYAHDSRTKATRIE